MNTFRPNSGRPSHSSSSEHSEIFGSNPSRNGNAGRPGFGKKHPFGNKPQNGKHSSNHPVAGNKVVGVFGRLPPHVAELRTLMNEQGVIVVSYICDTDSRALLSSVHLESRGLMLPQNGKALHSQIITSAREFYETALQDIPDIEIKDLNRLLKQDIEKILREILGRVPCVIVLIHTL